MVKKVINFAVFILLATLIVWVLAKIRGTEKMSENNNFIPLDAAIVLKLNNIEEFKDDIVNSNVWKQLSQISPFSNLESHILKVDSLFELNHKGLGDYDNTKLYISLHVIGKSKPDYMYRFVFPGAINEKNISQELEGLYNNSSNSSRKYEGKEINDVTIDGENDFSYTFFKNQLLISSSAIVLENILRQENQQANSKETEALSKLLNTAGRTVSSNLISNHRELSKFFQSQSRSNNLVPAKFLESFSDWSVLDLNLAENNILATGFSNSSDSLGNYLSVFRGQEPSKISFTSVAPANTKLFLSLNISDADLFNKNYKKYLINNGIEKKVTSYAGELKTQYSANLTEFLSLVDKELTYIRTDFDFENYDENVFSLVKVKSQSVAKNFLKQLVKNYCETNKLNSNNYQQTFQVDNSTKFEIIKLPVKNFLGNTFGSLFNELETPYFAFVDDYVVFANSRNALEKFIHFKILGKTLQNDFAFSKMGQYYSSSSNIYYYQDIPHSLDIISKLTNDKIVTSIRDNLEGFNKIPAFGFQFNSDMDFTFFSMFIQYFDRVETDAHTLWETLLDTSIRFKPTLFKNHYTDENEIFVQDLKNSIYLINKVGRVLWKVKLDEQIMGDVQQIDFYKNGKLQYLFSTKAKIHIIDRNGNYVERYPVNLRAEATAPLALFDYDNDKNYRVLIPTNDKKVYAYDIEGNILNGWEFEKSERIVKNQLQHFRDQDKDYIVFSDGLKTYILNRRGQERVPTNIIFQKSVNNNFVFEEKTALNNARMAVTDTSGQVWFFDFEGAHKTKAFRKLSAKHFFDFQDINADGYKDYIFLDEDELYVYDQRSEKEIYSYRFKNEITQRPIYFHFSFSDRKLGIIDETDNKVYLINNDGNLYKGFPLQGNSLYSIGKLTSSSRFNLIVGNNNNFLLNYSVQ